MKLTIEHLKGYLGTGLEWHNSIIGKTLKMQGCEFTNELRIRLADGLYVYDTCKIKPLLYPLSSLTEYREDLGFITMEFLNNHFRPFSKDLKIYIFSEELAIDIETENYSQDINLVDGFLIVKKLYEMHFDIHNLIENNLAIDKRTIKK